MLLATMLLGNVPQTCPCVVKESGTENKKPEWFKRTNVTSNSPYVQFFNLPYLPCPQSISSKITKQSIMWHLQTLNLSTVDSTGSKQRIILCSFLVPEKLYIFCLACFELREPLVQWHRFCSDRLHNQFHLTSNKLAAVRNETFLRMYRKTMTSSGLLLLFLTCFYTLIVSLFGLFIFWL